MFRVRYALLVGFVYFYDTYAICTKINVLKKKMLDILSRRFHSNLRIAWQKPFSVT